MLNHRRIALVCAIGTLAVTPSSALAMPATDPLPSPERQSAATAVPG